ncbi:MAG TPA: trypsin-like peptidase domain-containing protein, partial [Pirellulales bacterium]|nr:trypsin-like peptidase domain-containing protein [Pirellulales bacterium]
MRAPSLLPRAMIAWASLTVFAWCEEPLAVKGPELPAFEQLTDQVRKSVVVITSASRDGRHDALGSGFIISSDGQIATNYHVIGEGRGIRVQLADSRQFDATAVHASDRQLDLAIIKIDAQNLPALALGDSDAVKQGQHVLALGNPQG